MVLCQGGERIVLWIAGGEDVSAEPKLTRCGKCLAAAVSHSANSPYLKYFTLFFALEILLNVVKSGLMAFEL